MNKYGQGMVDLLLEKKNSRVKVPVAEEKEIAKHYREQLRIIQDKRNAGASGFIDFDSWQ